VTLIHVDRNQGCDQISATDSDAGSFFKVGGYKLKLRQASSNFRYTEHNATCFNLKVHRNSKQTCITAEVGFQHQAFISTSFTYSVPHNANKHIECAWLQQKYSIRSDGTAKPYYFR